MVLGIGGLDHRHVRGGGGGTLERRASQPRLLSGALKEGLRRGHVGSGLVPQGLEVIGAADARPLFPVEPRSLMSKTTG
eukprot:7853062-Heterocapsa_arctica.AAC.1